VRVSLSTYGSRGDVEPLVALAVRLREAAQTARAAWPSALPRRAVAASLLLDTISRGRPVAVGGVR
jgi:vancomycin aglycone glucosyltransferase